VSAIAEVLQTYRGSDGERTKALYERLSALGPGGLVAVELFRAQKASERAKVYRRGSHRGAAYDRKEWAMGRLCEALALHAEQLGLSWGWGLDEEQPVHRHVLYVDLPTGQASFHTAVRAIGPDYPGAWDGQRGQSPDRILRYVGRVLDGAGAP
jgi:hypothetical protein